MDIKHNNATQIQWVKYVEYTTDGNEQIEISRRYAVLLLLKGALRLTFNNTSHKMIEESSLVVIDQKQLTKSSWSAGTAILIFTPPSKMFKYFHSCSVAFSIPCSRVVPILPELQVWVEDLMGEPIKPTKELNDAGRQIYCARLAGILQNYPPLLVGELLISFQACGMSGSERCCANTNLKNSGITPKKTVIKTR